MSTRWVAALTLALAACNGPAPSGADATPTRDVRVGLDEYEVRVSHVRVVPEMLTFEVTNAGRQAHDLRVDGTDEPVATVVLAPGEGTTIAVDAAGADELVLWCTLPGHRNQGMATTLTVTAADAAGR